MNVNLSFRRLRSPYARPNPKPNLPQVMYVKNEIDRSRTRAYIGVRGHVRRVLVAALLNSYYNSNIKFYDNEFDEASYLLPFFVVMPLVTHY